MSSRDTLSLIAFVALCLTVSGIAGAITSISVETWYQSLQKPTYNPPDWVFAPIWTILYILMGIAAWRAWRAVRSVARRIALIAFAVQLGLNLAWSFLFFGLQRIDWVLVEIFVPILAIIATTIKFWRIDRLAGALLVPYGVWVAYAATLNISLWLLN